MAAIRSLRLLAAFCLLLAAGCERLTTEGFDPSSATYRPTAPRPVESVEHLTEPTVYTVDARSDNVWVYFDFSRAAVVPVLDPKSDGWDLAFKRYVVRTNGGRSNPGGQGAVLKLAGRDFTAVSRGARGTWNSRLTSTPRTACIRSTRSWRSGTTTAIWPTCWRRSRRFTSSGRRTASTPNCAC